MHNSLTLHYDPELACIRMIIEGYLTSQQFRTKTEELLELIITHRISKVLADTTYMKIIGADDQRWFIEDWLPRAVKAGYKACAMINSMYFFNRVAINAIADKIDKCQFTLQVFDDEAEAKQWLCSYQPQVLKYSLPELSLEKSLL